MIVRPATEADGAEVARLHNLGIDGRGATFDTEHRSAGQSAARIAATAPPHSFLVAHEEGAGVLVGFALTAPESTRAVYAGLGEYSVYVDPAAHGRGVGSLLLGELVRRAQEAGLHKLVGRVMADNAASLALAARQGFRVVGTHEAHAQLDGRWRDVVLVERHLLRGPGPG